MKRQVSVPGGLRKVIETGGPTVSPGTTIAELGATTVSLAQLKVLLGITTPAAGSSGSSGSTAAIVAGEGLIGGGPVIGAIPLYLRFPTPPVLWDDALLPDDFTGSAAGPGSSGIKVTDGTNTVVGATQVSFAGATVSGSTPNATVTVTGGGGGTTLAAAILADSPFAFWKCDDASTALVDSSGNAFNMTTVTGTPFYRFTSLIPSLPTTLFANVSGFLSSTAANSWQLTSTLGQTLPLTTWTAEFIWCPIAIAGTIRPFDWRVSGTAAVIAFFTISSSLYVDVNNAIIQLASTATFPSTKAAHIIVTCSTSAGTSTFNTYMNGVFIGTVTAAASTSSGGTSIASIGGGTYGGAASGMSIGYVALFPTVLTPARIAAHASAAGLLGM